MLVLPRSTDRARHASVGLRAALARALTKDGRLSSLIGHVIDGPQSKQISALARTARRLAYAFVAHLATRATTTLDAGKVAWAPPWTLLQTRVMRAMACFLTGGGTLVRVAEVATLGVAMLGLSASAAGTASPVSAAAPALAGSHAPTACTFRPAVARMMTTAEIDLPVQYGLRRDGSGKINMCAQPGLAIPAPAGGAPRLAGQVILVELSQEWLYAYQDGQLVLASPVSSGRPDLRTPTGTFSIQQKLADSMFTSPWPVGSPYYYAPLHVNYGLLFLTGGFYIHDAPWRTTYGPGSQDAHLAPNGAAETGSHGCVEMPTSTAARLYAWAQLGATVVIRP